MEKKFNADAKNDSEKGKDPSSYDISDAFIESAKNMKNSEHGEKDPDAFDPADAFLKPYED